MHILLLLIIRIILSNQSAEKSTCDHVTVGAVHVNHEMISESGSEVHILRSHATNVKYRVYSNTSPTKKTVSTWYEVGAGFFLPCFVDGQVDGKETYCKCVARNGENLISDKTRIPTSNKHPP